MFKVSRCNVFIFETKIRYDPYRGSGWVGFRKITGVALTGRTRVTPPLAADATIVGTRREKVLLLVVV